MSVQFAPQGLGLPMPEKPENLADTPCLKRAMDWVDENLPYKQNEIYRPELAWIRGGNCYAQALGCMALLDTWDIPTGIVLDETHAHVAALTEDGVFFLDPIYTEIRRARNEANRRGGHGLDALYNGPLADRLLDGACTLYFFRDFEEDDWDDWHMLETTVINGQTDLAEGERAHIVVDSRQGADMLCAIGDLRRYAEIDPLRYIEKYYDLRQYVPDFIHLDRPVY